MQFIRKGAVASGEMKCIAIGNPATEKSDQTANKHGEHKMKSATKLFAAIVGFGLCATATTHLQAQDVPLTVNIRGTAYTQGEDKNANPIIEKHTIATKDILTLIATAQGTNFPAKAKLVVSNETFFVQAPGFEQDVSQYISRTKGSGG